MRKFRLIWLCLVLLFALQLKAQFPGCNASSVSVFTTFPSNSVTNFTAYSKSLLLCGPGTIVYDTIIDMWGNNPMRNQVFIGELSSYVIKGIDDPDFVEIYVKSTATLDFRPAASLNSVMVIIIEIGATVWNNSGYNINIDTCANIIFPSGCLFTGIDVNSDNHAGAFRIWPTPVTDALNLQYRADANRPPTEILIYNNLGELVQTQKPAFENNKTSLVLSELNNGIYFLELKSSKVILTRKRFVLAK